MHFPDLPRGAWQYACAIELGDTEAFPDLTNNTELDVA
jgi:hypothetical protein